MQGLPPKRAQIGDTPLTAVQAAPQDNTFRQPNGFRPPAQRHPSAADLANHGRLVESLLLQGFGGSGSARCWQDGQQGAAGLGVD